MTVKTFKWSILALILHFAGIAYFAAVLPSDVRIPIHWNIYNEIDGWAGKSVGLLMFAGLNIFIFLLFFAMPWYSPWFKRHKERWDIVIPALTTLLVSFVGLMHMYSLYASIHGEVPGRCIMLVLIGLLFVALGNLLPKVPKNFIVGIKTPWTLANEAVWQRTHRLGGWTFVLSGLIMILKGLVEPANPTLQQVSSILVFAILMIPLPYSLFLYRRYIRQKQS